MADDYINIINKMTASGITEIKANFHSIFRNMIAL